MNGFVWQLRKIEENICFQFFSFRFSFPRFHQGTKSISSCQAAQDKEELQRKGDELDDKIRRAEKEGRKATGPFFLCKKDNFGKEEVYFVATPFLFEVCCFELM